MMAKYSKKLQDYAIKISSNFLIQGISAKKKENKQNIQGDAIH